MNFFETDEVKNLAVASLIIAIIFSLRKLSEFLFFFSAALISITIPLTVAKIVANKMNGKTFLKLNIGGSLAGLLLSLLKINLCPVINLESYGYKFGRWNRKFLWFTIKEQGIVSLSFVVTLLLLGTFFFFIGFKRIALLDAWLSLSIMLPFGSLEGEKIVRWDFGMWTFFFLLSILMVMLWI